MSLFCGTPIYGMVASSELCEIISSELSSLLEFWIEKRKLWNHFEYCLLYERDLTKEFDDVGDFTETANIWFIMKWGKHLFEKCFVNVGIAQLAFDPPPPLGQTGIPTYTDHFLKKGFPEFLSFPNKTLHCILSSFAGTKGNTWSCSWKSYFTSLAMHF